MACASDIADVSPHFLQNSSAEDEDVLFRRDGYIVRQKDVNRLNDGEVLNDVMIDFYLNHVWSRLPEERRDKIYIFSQFFFTKLAETGDPKEMHDRVSRWTKHVDLFEKDFIIVPINQSFHWYLAVICFPNLKGPVYSDNPSEMDMSIDSDEQWNGQVTKAPLIIVLDSLNDWKHYETTKRLRNYLTEEWSAKKPECVGRKFVGLRESFSMEGVVMKGYYPKAPQQDNSCDCGIFLLMYAEQFMASGLPGWKLGDSGLEFGEGLQRDLTSWFQASESEKKRSDLRQLMKELA